MSYFKHLAITFIIYRQQNIIEVKKTDKILFGETVLFDSYVAPEK